MFQRNKDLRTIISRGTFDQAQIPYDEARMGEPERPDGRQAPRERMERFRAWLRSLWLGPDAGGDAS